MRIVLDAIAPEPVEVVARGVTYKADPEMTAAEALYFMRAMSGAPEQVLSDSFLPKWASIISRCLAPHRPEMTPDQVLETFSLREMIGIIGGFLALNGQAMQALAPTLSTQAPPTTPGPTTTEASA